ncbi:hypothetical protein QTP88_010668 [Uroleucon formosanum]
MSLPSTSMAIVGRPIKPFIQSSDKTKRRKIKSILNENSNDKIIFATKTILYSDGNRAAADLLKQSTEYSPQRALKIKHTYNNRLSVVKSYTADEALALIIDAKLTKFSYSMLNKGSKPRKADIYPSYNKIKESKIKCYPDNYEVNEYGASIPLQNLVNHTAKRLLESLNISDQNLNEFKNLHLHFKWGCDGSSGHSEYHQKFIETKVESETVSINEKCDGNLFLFSLVPLELVESKNNSDFKNVLWKNQKSSSTRYCRPIKFLFEKETAYNTKSEVSKIKKEINELKPFEGPNSVQIHFFFYLTMVDECMLHIAYKKGILESNKRASVEQKNEMGIPQSWNRSIQQNGLSNDYKDKNSDIRRWLVHCYGLPFLSPGSVSEYFVNYLMKSKPDDERVTRFADYLVDVYISEEAQYPPEVWAEASAEPTLTTNACESFHSHFNSSFYTTHPNIFMFIEKLKEIQIEVYIKLNSINEPFKFQNSKTKKKRENLQSPNEMAIQKKKIQNGLWEKLGIKVDKVVQGKGTSNTGNIGRRFFEHAQEVSEITGLNKILIERFKVILSILACSYNVNFEKYDNYAKDTLKLYLQLYPWYRMPPSVHKILVHGSRAIHLAPFPIGILSEEAQEARNKDYIRFRRQNTRKTSRIDTNTDILHMFLITSDPIITSKSTQNIKEKNNKLCSEAMNLLNDIIETHTTRDLELDSNDSTEDSEFDSSDIHRH